MLVETVHEKSQKQFSLLSLLGAHRAQTIDEDSESYLYWQEKRIDDLIEAVARVSHEVEGKVGIVVRHEAGVDHVVDLKVDIAFSLDSGCSGATFGAVVVFEVLGAVCWQFEDFVALGGIEGLDEFGVLESSAASAVVEVVDVLVFEVEVKGGVAQVLFSAKTLVAGALLVLLGLGPPLSLGKPALFLARVAPLHFIIYYPIYCS